MQCRWICWASCDNWNFNASSPCLYVGGNYSQNGNHGLFYVNYNTATNANANIGCLTLLMQKLNLLNLAQMIAHPLVTMSN